MPDGVEGLSLAPLFAGDVGLHRELEDRVLFAHRARYIDQPPQLWAAIHRDWSLIQNADSLELYDFIEDPRQQQDHLLDELKAFQGRAWIDSERVEVELDPATLEMLRELGYVR